MVEWQKDQYKTEIGSKTVLVSYGGQCVQLDVVDEELRVRNPEELQGKHSETDTLIAVHASKEESNLIVRSSDTNVLLILISI